MEHHSKVTKTPDDPARRIHEARETAALCVVYSGAKMGGDRARARLHGRGEAGKSAVHAVAAASVTGCWQHGHFSGLRAAAACAAS